MEKLPLEIFITTYAGTALDNCIVGKDKVVMSEELKRAGFISNEKSVLEVLVAEVFVLHLPVLKYSLTGGRGDLVNVFNKTILSALQEEHNFSEEKVSEFKKLYNERYETYATFAIKEENLKKFIPNINESLTKYIEQDNGNLWMWLNSLFAAQLMVMDDFFTKNLEYFDEKKVQPPAPISKDIVQKETSPSETFKEKNRQHNKIATAAIITGAIIGLLHQGIGGAIAGAVLGFALSAIFGGLSDWARKN